MFHPPHPPHPLLSPLSRTLLLRKLAPLLASEMKVQTVMVCSSLLLFLSRASSSHDSPPRAALLEMFSLNSSLPQVAKRLLVLLQFGRQSSSLSSLSTSVFPRPLPLSSDPSFSLFHSLDYRVAARWGVLQDLGGGCSSPIRSGTVSQHDHDCGVYELRRSANYVLRVWGMAPSGEDR
jgi:hypothetical protein